MEDVGGLAGPRRYRSRSWNDINGGVGGAGISRRRRKNAVRRQQRFKAAARVLAGGAVHVEEINRGGPQAGNGGACQLQAGEQLPPPEFRQGRGAVEDLHGGHYRRRRAGGGPGLRRPRHRVARPCYTGVSGGDSASTHIAKPEAHAEQVAKLVKLAANQ